MTDKDIRFQEHKAPNNPSRQLDMGHISHISKSDEEQWGQIRLLRALNMKSGSNGSLEDLTQVSDEFDDTSLHFVSQNNQGDTIGSIRLTNRNNEVCENRLPIEAMYDIEVPADSVELSSLVVDTDMSTEDSAKVTLYLLRAALSSARSNSANERMYLTLHKSLAISCKDVMGVDFEKIGGSVAVHKLDPESVVISADPGTFASDIAKYEHDLQKNGKKSGLVAQFLEDRKKEQGLVSFELGVRNLGRVSLEAFGRNEAFITKHEQEYLYDHAEVAILGVGGDGGEMAVRLARMGVRKFRLADPEVFEIENINRQYGADYTTVGKKKVDIIAEEILKIQPDAILQIYPEGVNIDNVDEIISGTKLVIDETEYTKTELPVMIARSARKHNVVNMTVLNVGFGAQVTSYSPNGVSVEKQLGLKEDDYLDVVNTKKIPIYRWVSHIPKYFNADRFSVKMGDDTPTPSIAPGVGIASSVGSAQAITHLLCEISPWRKSQRIIFPHVYSIDSYEGGRRYRHGVLEFAKSAIVAMLRTRAGLNS